MEQLAAHQLLNDMGLDVSEMQESCSIEVEMAGSNEWEKFELSSNVIVLEGNEAAQERAWWKRGAFIQKDAFRCALLTSSVFTDIVSVDSWKRRIAEANEAATLLVAASSNDDGEHACFCTSKVADSMTKA